MEVRVEQMVTFAINVPWGEGCGSVLNREVGEGLPEELTLGQRLGACGRAKAGMCLGFFKKSRTLRLEGSGTRAGKRTKRHP
jgi:hypothetical protein